MTPLFSFEHVSVAPGGPGGPAILDDICLDVPADGVTCFAGPSGAGKSTLLRLCNRLEVPTSGVVRFRGDDVAGLDPLVLRRRVGMVFQQPAMFPGTVRDNLLVADAAATDVAFGAALDRAGLDRSFLARCADDLSGGEAQRACLARTLVTNPEVLLMDEPTSALDPPNTRRLEKLATDLAGTGVPVLWVSHDRAQTARLADRCIVLIAGRVVDDETADAYLRDEAEEE